MSFLVHSHTWYDECRRICSIRLCHIVRQCLARARWCHAVPCQSLHPVTGTRRCRFPLRWRQILAVADIIVSYICNKVKSRRGKERRFGFYVFSFCICLMNGLTRATKACKMTWRMKETLKWDISWTLTCCFMFFLSKHLFICRGLRHAYWILMFTSY